MKRAVVIVDLGFGDSGKGTVTDAVCRQINASLVVKFNGGCQCGHRVVLPDGRAHVFSQIGSGFFAGCSTFLSRFVLLEPHSMEHEATALEALGYRLPLETVWIDGDAPVVTPFHRAINRLLEWSRGDGRHGSCGMGIGALAEDVLREPTYVLRAKDLQHADVTREKLEIAWATKRNAVERIKHLLPKNLDVDTELDAFRPHDASLRSRIARWVERYAGFTRKVQILNAPPTFSAHANIVFEGAQGVLLDETHGFAPHHTWSNCTPANALALLEGSGHQVTTLGVTRAYATRHGAGPFPTEDPKLWTSLHPEASNHTHPYQGEFRVGHLDAVLLRYAIAACGGKIDGLAVTHLDAPMKQIGMATRYGALTCLPPGADLWSCGVRAHYRAYSGTERWQRFLRGLEMETQRPVLLESFGPTATDKRFSRSRAGTCGVRVKQGKG